MLTTNNFLGCFKLETGGLVIGWLSFISNILAVLLFTGALIGLSFFSCQDLIAMLKNHPEFDSATLDEESCSMARTVIIIICIVIGLIGVGFTIIAFLCIKGVEHRDHVRVRPMLIVVGICTVLSFLGVLSLTASGIISSIIYGCIYGYMFVVLYSLYDNFKREVTSGSTAQYQYQLPVGKA